MPTAYAILVLVAGTLANLLFAAMFVARVLAPRQAHRLGLAGTAMAVPLGAAALVAARNDMESWDVLLPLVFVVFALVEVVVDDVLHLGFRTTNWVWPYLGAFYLAQWALIGAAFRISTAGGAVMLMSYFVTLAATGYSYPKVGHGLPSPKGGR